MLAVINISSYWKIILQNTQQVLLRGDAQVRLLFQPDFLRLTNASVMHLKFMDVWTDNDYFGYIFALFIM